MDNYKIWEKKVEDNHKRNEQFINEFEEWLKEKNLVDKTIRKHINNANLYINDFLDGWFIEKCLWASKNSLKETAASIKKFYECMSEKGYIKTEDYKHLFNEIKENMDDFLDQMDAFDNGTYYDIF